MALLVGVVSSGVLLLLQRDGEAEVAILLAQVGIVEASDGVSVEAIVSMKEPTRIRIDGAPITDVFGNIHSSQCGASPLPAPASPTRTDPVQSFAINVGLFADAGNADRVLTRLIDAGLPALLRDPQWQPYLVFPGEYVAAERVVSEVQPAPGKRPLFVLLDATWSEARKMFRKSPYLDSLPVLSLQAEQLSRYKLRRSKRDDHFCTAEVAALCLELAGDQRAADGLNAYLDVFSQHYLAAKAPRAVPLDDPLHERLRAFL
mgnify:CR=1 FL=1